MTSLHYNKITFQIILIATLYWLVNNFSVNTISNYIKEFYIENIKISTELNNKVNDYTVNPIIRRLKLSRWGVTLNINSSGGSIESADNLIREIKKAKARGVVVTCIALNAMSTAFTIFQHCSTRIVDIDGILMQHRAHMGNGREALDATNSVELHTIMRFLDVHRIKEISAILGITQKEFFISTFNSLFLEGNDICEFGAADFITDNDNKLVDCKTIPKNPTKFVYRTIHPSTQESIQSFFRTYSLLE